MDINVIYHSGGNTPLEKSTYDAAQKGVVKLITERIKPLEIEIGNRQVTITFKDYTTNATLEVKDCEADLEAKIRKAAAGQ